MEQFNLASFSRSFNTSIKTLEKAEGTVRSKLSSLSRDTLFALHEHGNITFVNRLIKAKLTPMNRKTLVLFFQAFTGFAYESEKNEFTKKQKTQYDDKRKACLDALNDPAFDIWTWAEKSVDIQSAEWTPEKITKYMESALKKADKAGFKQADVIVAILKAGIDMGELSAIMESMIEPEEQQAA